MPGAIFIVCVSVPLCELLGSFVNADSTKLMCLHMGVCMFVETRALPFMFKYT